MSLGQFIVVILLIIGAALIGGLYKFLPPKPARAILASLIFGFDAILLTSVIKGCIGGALFARYGEMSDVVWPVLFLLFAVTSTAFVFLMVYRMNDPERARKVFFIVALVIFCASGICFVATAINGLVVKKLTLLPGQGCRQVCYTFPVVFFAKGRFRDLVFPYWCCFSVIGSFTTLCIPNNLLQSDSFEWQLADTVITHVIMMWVPIIIFMTQCFEAEYIHIGVGLIIYPCQMLFAYICNLINHAQTNSWENANAMYLTRAPMPSVPTWLFLLLCYVAGAGIGLALIFLKDRLRKSQ